MPEQQHPRVSVPAGPQSPAGEIDPVTDPGRYLEIERLGLVDAAAELLLQPIVDEAAERLGAQVALVSVVLDTQQYFAAQHGLRGWMAETRGTPVEWSFCLNTVRRKEPLVIEDATLNPLVSSSPLVHEGVRAYCGVPMVTGSGYALASLCVIEPDPRKFETTDVDELRVLARHAMSALESRAQTADRSRR